jgi:putative effector of murein hydrolase
MLVDDYSIKLNSNVAIEYMCTRCVLSHIHWFLICLNKGMCFYINMVKYFHKSFHNYNHVQTFITKSLYIKVLCLSKNESCL